MSTKSLAIWFTIAVVLGAAVFVNQRFRARGPAAPKEVLPSLQPASVTSVQFRPQGQQEIRAERTNGVWMLTEPIRYPAQGTIIEALLSELDRVIPATYIAPAELRNRASADEEFGFKTPQASLVINEGGRRTQLLVGARTAPGDQFFLQVVGDEGVYVLDAELLKLLPRNLDDLRDTSFVQLSALKFNRLSITNGLRVIELEREQGLWRLTRPSPARANQSLIDNLVQNLETVQINKFINDEARPDLEPFGLQPAELELAFKQGTNLLVLLRFGKAPTNDANQVYASRNTQPGVVCVSKGALEPWRGSLNDLRDPHLVRLAQPVNEVRVVSDTEFSLVQSTNLEWRVMPMNYPADPVLLTNLLDALTGMRIIEFTKDVVTPVDLAGYGLANPARKYILLTSSGTNSVPPTNQPIVELQFGTNIQEKVYARRTDENSIYAVHTNEFLALPSAPVQLRLRQLWDVSEDDLAGATIRQLGKVRQLLRKARHEWALAPGSQGVINDLAIEESVRPLCHLTAARWVARGADKRAAYGFSENGLQVTLEFKKGDKLTIDFGGADGADSAYASVMLEGEPWIFQLQPAVYRFVASYLTIPGNSP